LIRNIVFWSYVVSVVTFVTACGDSSKVESLVRAAESGEVAKIRQLLDSGADVNGCASWEGCETALLRAVGADRTNVVELLLQRGADPNKPDNVPLFAAAQRGNLPVVRLLISRGATLGNDSDLIARERETIRTDGGLEVYQLLFDERGVPRQAPH